jgi:hypothetical protein
MYSFAAVIDATTDKLSSCSLSLSLSLPPPAATNCIARCISRPLTFRTPRPCPRSLRRRSSGRPGRRPPYVCDGTREERQKVSLVGRVISIMIALIAGPDRTINLWDSRCRSRTHERACVRARSRAATGGLCEIRASTQPSSA